MDIQFVDYAEEAGYQRKITSFLAASWRCKVVPAAPDVVFFWLGESWIQLLPVIKSLYWTWGHHFKTRLRVRYNLAVGWHNIEIFPIMPAVRGGLYPVFPSWWDEYEWAYRLSVPTLLIYSYYNDSFVWKNSDYIRLVITLMMSEFVTLTGDQVLVYAAELVAADYYVGSSWFEHIEGGMLFTLPIPLIDVLSHFIFNRIAEKKRRDPELVSLAFHLMTEIDWSSSLSWMIFSS